MFPSECSRAHKFPLCCHRAHPQPRSRGSEELPLLPKTTRSTSPESWLPEDAYTAAVWAGPALQRGPNQRQYTEIFTLVQAGSIQTLRVLESTGQCLCRPLLGEGFLLLDLLLAHAECKRLWFQRAPAGIHKRLSHVNHHPDALPCASSLGTKAWLLCYTLSGSAPVVAIQGPWA